MGTGGCGDVGKQAAPFPFLTFLHGLGETATATFPGTGARPSRGTTGRAVASPPEPLLCLRELAAVWFGRALPFFDSDIFR